MFYKDYIKPKFVTYIKKFYKIFYPNNGNLENAVMIDETIFREYDIRGIYNESLFNRDAYLIGRGIATFLESRNIEKKVVVGYDGRLSSKPLLQNLVRGLVKSGCYVTNIGLSPTPIVSYALTVGEYDVGIMITGSHNPKEHNGFKISLKNEPLVGTDLQELLKILENQKFIDGIGRETIIQDIHNRYLSEILNSLNILGNLNVVWDVGNGVTSIMIKKAIKRLPGIHHVIFDGIDGRFPNRPPDPTVDENLTEIKKVIKERGCDFGIAFDGDGDRVVVVTHKGQMLYGDQLLAIFAKSILENAPNSTIISDIKASLSVVNYIKQIGGKHVFEKVGHSVIHKTLKYLHASLAGEFSGHFFFADRWYGFDDGIYAALRFLELASNAKNNGEYIFANIVNGFNTPEISVTCDDRRKFLVIEELKQYLDTKNIEYISIDGIRVESNIGWWLIRASNTQAKLTLRIEGTSVENLDKLKMDVYKILNTVCKLDFVI